MELNMNNQVAENTSENTIANQYFTFAIEYEDYGVEIANVKEIITMCSITKVPHTDNYLKGIINLRGEIIPVIDVRERFMKPSKEYDSLTCIIVIEYKDYSMGLIVDRVEEVMFISEESLTVPPNDKFGYYNQFIKNIGRAKDDNKVKLILDLDRLLIQGI